MGQEKIRVLFVCLGNICRSPMAEAVFQHIVNEEGLQDHFEISSAGTSSYHIGERPHVGTRKILKAHEVALKPDKRAQNINWDVMSHSDYIIVMDRENVRDLEQDGIKATRLLEYAPEGYPLDVPDPYYTDRFEEVYQLVEAGARGLLDHIRQRERV